MAGSATLQDRGMAVSVQQIRCLAGLLADQAGGGIPSVAQLGAAESQHCTSIPVESSHRSLASCKHMGCKVSGGTVTAAVQLPSGGVCPRDRAEQDQPGGAGAGCRHQGAAAT